MNIRSIASECFPGSNRQLFVNHSGSEPIPARKYLEDNRIPKKLIDRIISENGHWKYSNNSIPTLSQLSPNELNTRLRTIVNPIYNIINQSLDGSTKHGFNRHDQNHVDSVTSSVIHLLNVKHASKTTLKLAIIAARAHDLGNLLSRKAHSIISSNILSSVIPNLTKNKTIWNKIKNAIELHEEPIANAYLYSKNSPTYSKGISILSHEFGQETLALIIADKIQIGRNRVSKKASSKAALDVDNHLEVNLLGKTTRLTVTPQLAAWELQFTPELSKEEQTLYRAFMKKRSNHPGVRVYVSSNIQRRHREALPVPHFDTWRHLFWKIYFERTILTIQSLFALFPKMNRVDIIMRDSITQGSCAGETVTQTFERKSIDEHIHLLRLKYIPKEQRHDSASI